MKSGTKNKIKIFEDKKVQTVWDEKAEKWWFSIVDICAALTDSTDPAAYWRRLKQRLLPEGNETVTNCHGLKLKAPDGKMRLTDVADTEGGDGECATSGGTMQNCRVYRTAFSLIDTAISKSNASSSYFESFSDLNCLDKIDWDAVQATDWRNPYVNEKKQAEFLIENMFPWQLVEGIGVFSHIQQNQVESIVDKAIHKPCVKIQKSWYY